MALMKGCTKAGDRALRLSTSSNTFSCEHEHKHRNFENVFIPPFFLLWSEGNVTGPLRTGWNSQDGWRYSRPLVDVCLSHLAEEKKGEVISFSISRLKVKGRWFFFFFFNFGLGLRFLTKGARPKLWTPAPSIGPQVTFRLSPPTWPEIWYLWEVTMQLSTTWWWWSAPIWERMSLR